MIRLAFLVLCAALFPSTSAMAEPLSGRFVDLTHSFGADTIFWPTEEGFVLERGHAGRTEGGYYYEAHRFRSAEHGGTHVDAPIHFAEGRQTLDEIPLERLIAPGVVVDVTAACDKDRDHEITTDEIGHWEAKHGTIASGTIVLLRTGFAKHWPNRTAYLGTDERGAGAVAKLHFPGLHPDAARWLAAERKIAAVGIDTASIDRGQSTTYGSHVALFEKNVPAFENVAALEELPAKGFTVIALPMKIAGGSGGPLRIVAVLPGGPR